jgi:hypothetical protein
VILKGKRHDYLVQVSSTDKISEVFVSTNHRHTTRPSFFIPLLREAAEQLNTELLMQPNSTGQIAGNLSGPHDQHVAEVVPFAAQLSEEEAKRNALTYREQCRERPKIDEYESRELDALFAKQVRN